MLDQIPAVGKPVAAARHVAEAAEGSVAAGASALIVFHVEGQSYPSLRVRLLLMRLMLLLTMLLLTFTLTHSELLSQLALLMMEGTAFDVAAECLSSL